MKPLNGEKAMTPEERNARRRELDADPFHLALTRKTAKAWRDRNKEALNAKRRAKYAANRERELERQRAYAAAHPEVRKRAWAKWASKPENRIKLLMRDRKRSADPVEKEKRKAQRAEKIRTDPAYAENIRAQKRRAYHRHKYDAIGLRWKYRFLWMPKWRQILAQGLERIEQYRKRCCVQTWSYFVKWYKRETGVQLDPQKRIIEK